MNNQTWKWALALSMVCICTAQATSRYENVAKKHKVALTEQQVNSAKMQGDCLVELKELTFKKKDEFDPVSEWTNYRSVSLLEQYSPCEVLIMLEVANAEIRKRTEK